MLTRSTFGLSRPSSVRVATDDANVCKASDGFDALQVVKKHSVSVGKIRRPNRFSEL